MNGCIFPFALLTFRTMARNPDAIVVGAGIIGCAIAWELAKEGRRVVLFDKGPVGRAASWAAAG
ncbi:MAG TPA: FAD-dependent oxidoreductase, partial [Planctomycetota bacterium]|nr:FAD-dependent oxidoreductase [Planctomycetota bacterium]